MQCDYCAKCRELCPHVFKARLGMCDRFSMRALSAAEENCFMRGPYVRQEEN